MASIAEQILAARTEKEWTQTQLAEKLGVSLGSIAGWESGRTEPKRAHILKAMTKVLGIEFPEAGGSEEGETEETEETKVTEKSAKKQGIELAKALGPIFSDPIRSKVVRLLTVAHENSISVKSLLKILEDQEEE